MRRSDAQRLAIIYAMDVLATRFAEHEDVYVSGDLLIYYQEGNPRASIAPDVFVAYGVARRKRPTYLLWEEGKAPDFVLEVASPNTWREDEGAKRRVYERLGVREYCQYDPTGEFLGTRLKGARLAAGRYETLAAGRSAGGGPTLSSEVLQLELFIDGEGEFRFRDRVTGQVLLSHLEEHVRADREAVRADRETVRADRETVRADQEAVRADREAVRADQEAAARRTAEARIAELLRERRR